MEDIKNIKIINQNIDILKKDIRLARFTNIVSITNMGIMGKTLSNYSNQIDISAKFIGMLAIGMCYVLLRINIERIKRQKFRIDELEFEIEKIEEKSL